MFYTLGLQSLQFHLFLTDQRPEPDLDEDCLTSPGCLQFPLELCCDLQFSLSAPEPAAAASNQYLRRCGAKEGIVAPSLGTGRVSQGIFLMIFQFSIWNSSAIA